MEGVRQSSASVESDPTLPELPYEAAPPRYEKNGRLYLINGQRVPSVTEVLTYAGIVDLSAINPIKLKQAAERGTAVHKLCEQYDQDELDWAATPIELMGHLEAYMQFRKDTGFRPELIEHPVYNSELMVAGTLDRTGEFTLLRDRPVGILDIKTGRVLQPSVPIQLAGYQECMPMRYKRFALRLDGNGTYELQEYVDPFDAGVFRAAVQVTWWKLRNKRAEWRREGD